MSRRDLELAEVAAKVVEGVEGTEESEFRSRARQLPSMILTQGLASTTAFLESKQGKKKPIEKAYGKVLRAIEAEVQKALGINEGLLDWLTSGNVASTDYRTATRAALDVSSWIKRLAEARLGAAE